MMKTRTIPQPFKIWVTHIFYFIFQHAFALSFKLQSLNKIYYLEKKITVTAANTIKGVVKGACVEKRVERIFLDLSM